MLGMTVQEKSIQQFTIDYNFSLSNFNGYHYSAMAVLGVVFFSQEGSVNDGDIKPSGFSIRLTMLLEKI